MTDARSMVRGWLGRPDQPQGIAVHFAPVGAPIGADGGTSLSDGWLQLIPAGTFSGRDGRGPYTLSDVAAVIAATEALGRDIAVDRDHATDLAPAGSPVPAAGWITDIEDRGAGPQGGIWGRIAWTERARQQLEAREYRYLSPVFEHRPDGTITRILRASLTNNPNLQLRAVASSQPGSSPLTEDTLYMSLAKQVAAALGLPAETPEAQLVAAVQAAATVLPKVAQAAGLGADAKPDAIVTAVQTAVTKAAQAGQPSQPDPAKYVPIEQVTALQTQLQQLGERAAIEDVDRAIQSGQIAPAMRDWALSYRRSDPAGFAGYLKSAPALVSPHRSSASAVPPSGAGTGGAAPMDVGDIYKTYHQAVGGVK